MMLLLYLSDIILQMRGRTITSDWYFSDITVDMYACIYIPAIPSPLNELGGYAVGVGVT